MNVRAAPREPLATHSTAHVARIAARRRESPKTTDTCQKRPLRLCFNTHKHTRSLTDRAAAGGAGTNEKFPPRERPPGVKRLGSS